MWEFIQAYGYWIVIGLFLVFMLRMHLGGHSGHGRGGGDGERDGTGPTGTDSDGRQDVGASSSTSRPSGHH